MNTDKRRSDFLATKKNEKIS